MSADPGPLIEPDAGCVCGRKNDYTATLPLNCVCDEGGCAPLSVPAPLDACPLPSSLDWGPIVRRGCGFVEYERSSFSGGGKRRYDAASGALVAVSHWSDIAGAPCGTAALEAGPFEDCPAFVECLNCRTAPDGTNGMPLCSELE